MKHNLLIYLLLLLPLTIIAQNQVPDDEENPYYILSGEADKAIADGDYSTAAQRLTEAIDIDPNNPSNVLLLSNLGIVYNYLDKDTLALDAFNKALRMAPAMTVTLVNRGKLLLKMGDSAGAFQDFNSVIERDSTNVSARYYHGLMSLYGGDRFGAEDDFNVLKSEDPDSYSTYVALSSLYSMTERDREAIPYYKKLIEIDPSAEFYAALAGCYLALGELSEASTLLAEAMEKYPRDAELYYYRAWLNRDRFQIKEAKEDAHIAVSLGLDRRKANALFE